MSRSTPAATKSTAHLGELSVTSLQARGVAGCVLDGGCRDVRFILDEGFPVFCSHVTPEDSTWRWELEATQVPITIGRVRVEPGDWVVGDDDGVVVVPAGIAEDVLAEAEEKAATESEIRAAVREGMSPARGVRTLRHLLARSTSAGGTVDRSALSFHPYRARLCKEATALVQARARAPHSSAGGGRGFQAGEESLFSVSVIRCGSPPPRSTL